MRYRRYLRLHTYCIIDTQTVASVNLSFFRVVDVKHGGIVHRSAYFTVSQPRIHMEINNVVNGVVKEATNETGTDTCPVSHGTNRTLRATDTTYASRNQFVPYTRARTHAATYENTWVNKIQIFVDNTKSDFLSHDPLEISGWPATRRNLRTFRHSFVPPFLSFRLKNCRCRRRHGISLVIILKFVSLPSAKRFVFAIGRIVIPFAITCRVLYETHNERRAPYTLRTSNCRLPTWGFVRFRVSVMQNVSNDDVFVREFSLDTFLPESRN